jgi:hypothetical protein
LKLDVPVELWDWDELPIGPIAYNISLGPRDWTIPQSALLEMMRIINTPPLGEKEYAEKINNHLLGKRLGYLEVMTREGPLVVLSDMPEEPPKLSLLDRLLVFLKRK